MLQPLAIGDRDGAAGLGTNTHCKYRKGGPVPSLVLRPITIAEHDYRRSVGGRRQQALREVQRLSRTTAGGGQDQLVQLPEIIVQRVIIGAERDIEMGAGGEQDDADPMPRRMGQKLVKLDLCAAQTTGELIGRVHRAGDIHQQEDIAFGPRRRRVTVQQQTWPGSGDRE